MNIHKLREAQVRFESKIVAIEENRKKIHQLRLEFINHFDINRIMKMDKDEYVTGIESSKKGFNFCYFLERKLDGLGRVTGAPAHKFGIYFGKKGKDSIREYQFVKRFGNTPNNAFEGIRKSLIELLIAGKNQDIESLKNNLISPMIKGKILSTYFAERYLNIFSPSHLNYFLIQLDLDNKKLLSKDPILKREALLKFKNDDEIMKNWSVDLFSHFLYTEYPGSPKNSNISHNFSYDILSDYRQPDFPSDYFPEFINLIPLPINTSTYQKNNLSSPNKKDYEKESRKLKMLGDRGEKIVFDLEVKKLIEAGKDDLAKKVDRVSLKSDSYGYDILSFELDGSERHIEVKSSTSNVGSANFFLSDYELKTAKSSKNYYIYMVYGVTTKFPKVWTIQNPFLEKKSSIFFVPTNYRVTINVSKQE